MRAGGVHVGSGVSAKRLYYKEVQASGQTELVSVGVCRLTWAQRYQTKHFVYALLPVCPYMHTET